MQNKTYDFLKYVALIALPGAIALYGVIGGTLNIPLTQEVITIAIAFNTFLGSLIGLSAINYKKNQ